MNAAETFSLPIGTFKNPTAVCNNGRSICVIDEGQVQCWKKNYEKKLADPYEPLKDFAGRYPLPHSTILCGTFAPLKASVGTKCATTRGFHECPLVSNLNPNYLDLMLMGKFSLSNGTITGWSMIPSQRPEFYDGDFLHLRGHSGPGFFKISNCFDNTYKFTMLQTPPIQTLQCM